MGLALYGGPAVNRGLRAVCGNGYYLELGACDLFAGHVGLGDRYKRFGVDHFDRCAALSHELTAARSLYIKHAVEIELEVDGICEDITRRSIYLGQGIDLVHDELLGDVPCCRCRSGVGALDNVAVGLGDLELCACEQVVAVGLADGHGISVKVVNCGELDVLAVVDELRRCICGEYLLLGINCNVAVRVNGEGNGAADLLIAGRSFFLGDGVGTLGES